MARKKKRTTIRGNLIKIGLVFAAGTALAVVLPMMGSGYQPLVPDGFDPEFQMAKRQAPENAYPVFDAANQLLPETPGELQGAFDGALNRDRYAFDVEFKAPLADFLGVAAGPAPGAMTDYLLLCADAAAKVREAVAKPYYLLPEPPQLSVRGRKDYWDFPQMGVRVLGYGAVLTNDPATLRQGLETILDVVRMSRMMWPEESGQYFFSRGLEDVASGVLCQSLSKPGMDEQLPWLLEQWKALGAPGTPRIEMLRIFWRRFDNTILYKSPEMDDRDFGDKVELMFFHMEVESWADGVAQHREAFDLLSKLPPSKFDTVIKNFPRLAQQGRRERQLQWNLVLLKQAALYDVSYARTLLAMALERYRQAEGNYPDKLDRLVPDYLDPIPKDATNDLAFRYEADENGYRLRSIGLNEQDDQGGGDDYLVLDLFAKEG
ncbi:MAG: hypothetical protein GC168_12820 [Candidatus Hydrogenedens sp.]|nr:hypothetical protein [Candidatus Hydrogenedens sp.]